MRLTKNLLYILPPVIAFYVIPLILFLLTPVLAYGLTLFFLIQWYVITPIVCFASPLVYGAKNRFKPTHLLFPVLVGVLYLSSLFIFFGIDIIFGDIAKFLFAYMFIALLGNVIGALLNIYRSANNR